MSSQGHFMPHTYASSRRAVTLITIAATLILTGCGKQTDPEPQDEPEVVVTFPDSNPDVVVARDMDEQHGEHTPDLRPDVIDDPDMREDEPGPDMRPPNEGVGSCAPVFGWDGTTPAFAEQTSAAALDTIDAQGTRISAVDFNGDGHTDLVLRRAANRGDDFSDGGTRGVWLLANNGQGGFEDVTQSSGFVQMRSPAQDKGRPVESVAWADIDNDGDLDAVTTTFEASPDRVTGEDTEIVLNDGDGSFSLIDLAKNPLRRDGASNRGGLAFTDFDLDGDVDLWVGNGSAQDGPEQDELWRNDGDAGLTNVTDAMGMTTKAWSQISDLNQAKAHTNSWGVGACDLNNDGKPELLSASYGRAPNHLWRSQSSLTGAQTYANHSLASGYAFDDRQDWSDNESARCHCKINPTDPGCDNIPAPRIACSTQADAFRWQHQYDRNAFRLGGNSGTTVCADLNNDGWMDLLTTEIVHWDVGTSSDPSEVLYNNADGSITFTRPGNDATGLTRVNESATWDNGDITAAVFDFDNDGRLDIYIGSTDYPGTRGWLYRQNKDQTYSPIALDLGIDHKSSHGVGVADFDNDGDLDIVVGHSRNRCSSGDHCYPEGHARYFENRAGLANNWLQLDLTGGPGSNRAAIGARVVIETDELTQTRIVDGGHGHYGIQHDLRVHAGLGSACGAKVTITWPDAARTTQTLTLQANKRYAVTQGEDATIHELSP